MAEEPKERKAFEAHMRVGGYSNHDKHPDGSYVSSAMELWWQGWKARAQLPSLGGEAVEVVCTRYSRITEQGRKVSLIRLSRKRRYEGWDAEDLMTVAQHQRILAASAGSADHVGVVFTMEALAPGGGVKSHASLNRDLPAGTKLYTHPADQVAGPANQIAWKRRDGVMGCKRFMTQKCYDAQSPQMKGNYEPFYCAHCVADQVAEGVVVSRELLEQATNFARPDLMEIALGQLTALMANSEGVKT